VVYKWCVAVVIECTGDVRVVCVMKCKDGDMQCIGVPLEAQTIL
jgi:hypothetical protein